MLETTRKNVVTEKLTIVKKGIILIIKIPKKGRKYHQINSAQLIVYCKSKKI